MNKELLKELPQMKTGEELFTEMLYLPEYNDNIRAENQAIRLTALSDMYDIYIPSTMSQEIYSKLYLALLRSLQKKFTTLATRQQNENYKIIRGQVYNSVIGGSDSFTIIGTSGIGKSTAINKSISLLSESPFIEIEKPYAKIIPSLVIQCPFDSSVKGLLLEVLRKTDEIIGSKYYENALRTRATTDMLITISINDKGRLR